MMLASLMPSTRAGGAVQGLGWVAMNSDDTYLPGAAGREPRE